MAFPVYTGNTVEGWGWFLFISVYPCVYREHTLDADFTTKTSGLSLCIQGTLL